ncbi:SDR family NAD(P)-dependent oxidoreductase [Alicyclobacillus mali]|uniref:SDR family NAD(P)-dependent oxidoreductase n=1 Tax=Alicyclobacillus mali (ex Roth et al. 2021) TaxID=1123961 RepID=A0ABS0F073_9BACL|nr:SDR family NAD(P)-dependent oxidoreductase [Alicyclobacillus mali (ex Roth et al. 2021)]MBF8376694.1 SDR family NAD(P)-dependent oxidoreductase [Alicyclobacillus mali (ex Roth et al. 2021)]MCL6488597.1 SDR family NAD(P)-dependent oxidoreductase [Alicyclobacillus mali (ex Roth et al. 2021)]
MDWNGNTILVTGGSNGIGLALAVRFLERGNRVIICGRRQEKLDEAKAAHPDLETICCDVMRPEERLRLLTYMNETYPDWNVLVNNAGIQQHIHVRRAAEPWEHYEREIAINFDAPVHLTLAALPHLLERPRAAVVNVTSGLALAPAAWAPVYSATKAALRSFTQSLRLQLQGTSVDVVEIVPPAVNTDLGGPGLHTFGVPVDEFADGVFEKLEAGAEEIGYGDAERRLSLVPQDLRKAAEQMWAGFRARNPDF